MASIVRMPEIAANAESATLLSWEVAEGAAVREGDTLALIETDKATVDLVAEHAGTLTRVLVEAGQQVEVGAPVAWLLAAGETDEQAPSFLSTESAEPATGREGRVFASPLARRLAAERGVNLGDIAGSGPNGRVVKRDVLGGSVTALEVLASAIANEAPVTGAAMSSAASPGKTSQALSQPSSAPRPDKDQTITHVPHSNMRRTIARRLSESKATIPHFYLETECRVEALLTLRNQINGSIDGKISINDLIIKAVACALRDVPAMNVAWTDDAMLHHDEVDISVAVSTDQGLYTPVLRNVGQMPLRGISHNMSVLAQRARDGELAPAEYQGGTFSISNLGMFGVSSFNAIINPPQSAILAVGAVRRTPVAVEDQVRVEPVLKCTLSVDHRAIDGVLAAQWLSCYTRYIEQPWAMLV